MESQIVQEKLGEIVVYIVKRSSYTQKDQESIRNEIEKWISNSLKVKFVYVPEIEREPNGKFRAVKSLLKEAISDDGCPDCGLPI
jgi:phenylacetate-CoA ligase